MISDNNKRNPDYIQPSSPLPDTPGIRQDMANHMESVEHADSCFGQIMGALDRNGLREDTVESGLEIHFFQPDNDDRPVNGAGVLFFH